MPDEQEPLNHKLLALRNDYLVSLPERLDSLSASTEKLLERWEHTEADKLHRLSHSLAGSGATYGFQGISILAKQLENLLSDIRNRNAVAEAHELEQIHAYVQGIKSAVDDAIKQNTNHDNFSSDADAGTDITPQNRCILLVDEDTQQADQLSLLLSQADFDVICLNTPETLEETIRHKQPAALVLNVMLPESGTAGIENYQEILNRTPRKLPTLFISRRNDIEARLAAVRAGADHYFTSPVDSINLLNTLCSVTNTVIPEKFNIAIIDDDADTAEHHAQILRSADMQVSVITDPLTSLEQLANIKPDLILMDADMPTCDGIELASVLRQERFMRGIPVIYLSTQTDLQQQITAMKKGGNDFIRKPVDPEYLISIVTARVEQAHQDIRNADQLQRSLRENQAQKMAMDQHAIISVTDKRGNIISVNNKFCEISRYSRQELIGENHRILNSGYHPREFFQEMWRTISNGGVWQGEICNRRKDGGHYWVESTIMPLPDEAGRPYQYISIRTDVTNIKDAEIEAEKRQQLSQELRNITARFLNNISEHDTIFEGLLNIACKYTRSEYGYIGKIIYTGTQSPYLQTLALTDIAWDRETSGLHEANFGQDRVFPDPDTLFSHVLQTDTPVIHNAPYHDPHHAEPPSNPPLNAFMGIPVFYGNRMIAILGLANRQGGYTDKILETLEPVSSTIGVILNAIHMDEERRRTQMALQLAKDEAEKANRAKSDFLSSMSHELRTPMNAILGFAQLLEFDRENPLSDVQQENIQQILKGGWHLLDLINEILDLSRIETGNLTLSLEKVCLQDVLQDCIGMAEPIARGRNITIENRIPAKPRLHVIADRTRLKQVLLNLINNGVKYNSDNGRIILAANMTDNDMVRVAIKDTGPGIPADQIHRLFQPFERLVDENSRIEGTGIGLVITKRLIDMMNGSIHVESQAGIGSTFWFELPSHDSSEDSNSMQFQAKTLEKTTHTVDTTKQNKLVLYIEDNPANLRLVQQLIDRRSNLEMISAHNAEFGIDLARGHKPDLIILDINLPGMDGFDALRQLRLHEETMDIPVVALSANALPRDIERGIRKGFSAYLTKPLNIQDFLNTIDEILF